MMERSHADISIREHHIDKTQPYNTMYAIVGKTWCKPHTLMLKNPIYNLRHTNVVVYSIERLSKGLRHVVGQYGSILLNCIH